MTALATGTAGVDEVSDTFTITSTSAVFVAGGKVPACTSTAGSVTAVTTSANDLKFTVTGNIAAAATTIKCDGTTSYTGLQGGVGTTVDTSANDDAIFTITNSLAGHYLFSVTTAGTGYVAGNTITVLGTLLGGATPANDAVLTVIGAAGIGATAAEALTAANVMIMGTPVASATAGAFAVNPAAGTIPFTMVTTKDTTSATATTTYDTRAATASSFTSVATSNELVVGLVPRFLTFVFTPATALAGGNGSYNYDGRDQRIRRHDHDQFDKRGFRRRQGANLHSLWWVCWTRDGLGAISERPQAHGDGGHCRQYGDNDQVRRDDVVRGPSVAGVW